MAQGRPLSRHGRYNALVGMPTTDAESHELYRSSQYLPRSTNLSTKTHSSSITQVLSSDYEQRAQVNSSQKVVVAHFMSGHNKDSISCHHLPPENSKDQSTFAATAQSKSGSDASYHVLQNMSTNQPRPPSSSRRPTSASVRAMSARRRNSRQEESHVLSEEKPVVRPPSSFSKYRPLPAIGTPVPVDQTDVSSTNHLFNATKHSPLHQHLQQHDRLKTSQSVQQSQKSNNRVKESSRCSVMSDNSILSSREPTLKIPADVNADIISIERLDLSQLDEPAEGCKRKSKADSSYTKPKGASHRKKKTSTGDLYDGDDDDSDSTQSPVSKYDVSLILHNPSKSTAKKPVVIPSPDNLPSREVLLAVKLPTDGTRHQKFFNTNETLQSIVEFAEEMADRSFHGYILVVASAPKNVFVDLEDTIENAGLEDKTVFHLEEYEWED